MSCGIGREELADDRGRRGGGRCQDEQDAEQRRPSAREPACGRSGRRQTPTPDKVLRGVVAGHGWRIGWPRRAAPGRILVNPEAIWSAIEEPQK
jgi:hypothetical protein